jgi:Flp pilus assembly protein TadB
MTEQEQQQQDRFDKIRADADKKRQARIEEKTKAAEFFARMKNGDDSLKRINQRLLGDNK